MKRILICLLLVISTIACKNATNDKSKADKETKARDTVATEDGKNVTTETKSEWQYLFDGTSLDGWRAYGEDKMPPGWVIEDKVLTYKTKLGKEEDYHGGRDIIYGAEKFDNFELYIEWKLPKGGNSGIFYHIKEGYKNPSKVSPEYQLIDDENYEKIHNLVGYNKSLGHTKNLSELKPLNKTAADYSMHAPEDPDNKKLNPVGEWNTSRIIFTPEKVEHWLNGKKVLSFKPWSDEWYEKKNSGKWKNSPDYGKFKTGYIGLQDHQSSLWFRNIKIRKL